MSITILSTPQEMTPAYNKNYFYFDSTEKSEVGFRYLVSVISGGITLGTYKLKPIPTTLYGEVDVSKVIQQSLGQSFDPTQDNGYIPTAQFLDFTLQIDEEYLVNEPFTDYTFAGSSNWPNHSDPAFNPNGLARTALKHSSEPLYSQGDIINVVQEASANFRPELEGIHTVLDVYLSGGFYYTVLDLTWIGSGAASAGDSFYADNKKSIFTGVTSSEVTAYRGAFGFVEYNTYDFEDWQTLNSTSNLLTTLTETRISRDNPTWLKLYKVGEGSIYAVFNIAGTRYRYIVGAANTFYLINTLPSDDNILEVYNGTAWVAFGGGLDLSTIKTYDLIIATSADLQLSKAYTINLYDDCDFYDTFDVCFMDRLGSWITIPFNKGSYVTQKVNRSTFRKKYGSLVDSDWTYSLQDRGLENYHIEEELTYKVNTGQLSEVESQYMKELVSSPFVFVSVNGADFESINIINSSLPLNKKRTQRDRKVQLTFVKSVQDNINI